MFSKDCTKLHMADESLQQAPGPGSAPTLWTRRTEACGDGIVTYRLASWLAFLRFLESEVFRSPDAAKRRCAAKRRDDWSLSSSLDRHFEKIRLLSASVEEREQRSIEHLKEFKRASRGRRGPNPPKMETENDWWALGQHYGLATPLLDWLRSPFGAAYFAFELGELPPTPYRVVFGLDERAAAENLRDRPWTVVGNKSSSDSRTHRPSLRRLVSQGGLFTRGPLGVPVERWVAEEFEGSADPVLLRIEIPNAERTTSLRALQTMNINHLSYFQISAARRLIFEFTSRVR